MIEEKDEQIKEVIEVKKESKIKSLISKLPKWKKPSDGLYLTMKEWLFFIIGGMGVMGVTGLIGFATLQQGMYIVAARNINVWHVSILAIVTSVVYVLSTPLVSWLIDNTNTKYGKFRPYLFILPIPIVLSYLGIGLTLYIENYWTMIVVYAIVFNFLNFLNRLYLAAFNGIIQVVSPSMRERTQLMSIGTFFTSLGPTISVFLFPVLANLLYANKGGDGVNNINAFTWVLPLLVAVFAAVGILMAFGVKERAVISKEYKQKQKFIEGVKKTAENKYFWILNMSNMLGVLKIFAATTFPAWYVIYIIAPWLQDIGVVGELAEFTQSLVTMLITDATVPGMLLAPWLIRKFGKKKLNIFLNFGIAVSLVPMLFINNVWVHLVCCYLMTLFNGLSVVTLPACQAEINDYQQFKTGDRIEGFLTQFGGMFPIAIGIGTGFIPTAIYAMFGYTNDPNVLYDNEILFNIVNIMSIVCIVSAICAAIPYFFWDMTEKRHREIMEVLAIRVKYEDGEIDLDTKEMLENEALNGNINVLSMYEESLSKDVEKSNVDDSTNIVKD